jgi:hypothetical protein
MAGAQRKLQQRKMKVSDDVIAAWQETMRGELDLPPEGWYTGKEWCEMMDVSHNVFKSNIGKWMDKNPNIKRRKYHTKNSSGVWRKENHYFMPEAGAKA